MNFKKIDKVRMLKTISLACVLSLSTIAINLNAEVTSVNSSDTQTKPKLGDVIEKNSEIRNERMAEYKDIRKDNMAERKDIRDTRKEEMKNIKTDFKDAKKELRTDFKDARQEMKDSGMNRKDMRASSTEMFKVMKDQKRELSKKMQMSVFETRKNALVKELTVSLNNLTNIRGRINEKITKIETEGKTVTEARTALTTADDKLLKAKTAIDAFSNIKYITSNTASTTSATTEIELDKPRIAGDSAIKSVKEARDALKKVVEIISTLK